METKIVGGIHSDITDFPQAVFLSILPGTLSEAYISWICGSSILNQKILLTAAHCLNECPHKCWISMSTGHTKITTRYASSISHYVIHDEYNEETITNDIALVKLKTALTFGPTVSRVALLRNPPYEEMAQVAGWGMINEDKEILGNELKSVIQYVHNNEDCLDLLNSTLPSGTFCASSGTVDDYASGGDSGSALVVRGYIQIGLVSFKKPYLNRHVVVYTDTGYFYEWININAHSLICNKNN